MNLIYISLTESSQSVKITHNVISWYDIPEKAKLQRQLKSVVARQLDLGGSGMCEAYGIF